MPYANIEKLPKPVRDNLPKKAQEIYAKAFNNAWDQYRDAKKRQEDTSREVTAHKVAWATVKKEFEKNSDGKWMKKRPY